jgi:hypothetical protein
MLTPGTAANASWAHEPNGQTGFGTRIVREFKRPVALALLFLAVVGWLAAVFSFWHQPDGQEQQRPAPVEHSEDQEKALTEANATQQKLATAQSALSATTRLRDEAAQALQEVRDRSAAVKKDLAAARDQLDDVQQKITAHNAELTTISKRLDTARVREAQVNQKVNATPRDGSKAIPRMPATAIINKESSSPTPATTATGSISPITAASPPPNAPVVPAPTASVSAAPAAASIPVERGVSPTASDQRLLDPIDPGSPANAPNPTAALKPSVKSSPAPVRKPKNALDASKSIEVIGPGDSSSPSDFELRSGRISRTP